MVEDTLEAISSDEIGIATALARYEHHNYFD